MDDICTLAPMLFGTFSFTCGSFFIKAHKHKKIRRREITEIAITNLKKKYNKKKVKEEPAWFDHPGIACLFIPELGLLYHGCGSVCPPFKKKTKQQKSFLYCALRLKVPKTSSVQQITKT